MIFPYAQADQSLYWSLGYSKSIKLLTERHLEFLSLKGGCTGSSESILNATLLEITCRGSCILDNVCKIGISSIRSDTFLFLFHRKVRILP